MDIVKIALDHVPRILYTKYSNPFIGESLLATELLTNLSGNPDGSKVSTVPYIYCLSEEQMIQNEMENIYFLRVHFDWPRHGFIAEEEEDKSKSLTYEDYKREGFAGVTRYFVDTWRYVIFDPESCIRCIYDVGKEELVYEKKHALRVRDDMLNGQKSSSENGILIRHDSESQEIVDAMMLERIGLDYIDKQRDMFCVTEIARRQSCSVASIVRRLVTVLQRISICRASGCWMSTNRSDYKRTFWLSLGGISHSNIFSFASQSEEDHPNIVIKNKNILHSHICELTWGKKHSKCCRPSHLRLGTSKENVMHIKVRKNVEQLFDFSPEEMRAYAFHIYSISHLVENQLQIMRPEEKRAMEKRKGNKIIVYENEKGNLVRKIIGMPNMGESEPVGEVNDDDDFLGIDPLFSQNNPLDVGMKYKSKLLSNKE